MLPLTDATITTLFVNASRKEIADITLPGGFGDVKWDELDYFGWRDPRLARRAYIVVPVDGEFVGIVLKQSEASPRRRAQCTWCQDVKLPNDVVFYSAKRVGAAGRNGNTLGTLICDEFQCSRNVRKPVPPAYLGFDVAAATLQRIETLRVRSAGFAADVQRAG
ncbi:treble-clef zinc-finger protein [Glaciihabitans tibetensis]|uniref:Treble-clef zinc-finger protein n=1 Tax=Glaciihabitans tibetensis TaxID=1266600 RepID=A0A2T0VDQ4_9MICO|nr:FBP domain-containing protein [Glaciihabitans tibetensis]PRY68309.1 treble-clef zinc-finger protein [Glaciihabitans tibetensis]